jgi:hypothetical protein
MYVCINSCMYIRTYTFSVRQYKCLYVCTSLLVFICISYVRAISSLCMQVFICVCILTSACTYLRIPVLVQRGASGYLASISILHGSKGCSMVHKQMQQLSLQHTCQSTCTEPLRTSRGDDSMTQHDTAWHSRTQQDTARDSTTQHDTETARGKCHSRIQHKNMTQQNTA